MEVLHLALYILVFCAFSVLASPALVHDTQVTAESLRLPWPVSPLQVRPNTFHLAMIQQ